MISPDLSTKDPSRIISSGGIVGDNLGQFYGEVVFAIAPSPAQRGLIWAGTNDGKLWNTRDGGANWTDVTKNITGLPAWSVVSKIEPSNFDGGTAYIAVDGHLTDGRQPLLFKTTDFGATWKSVSGDLPSKHPLDYTLADRREPEPARHALRRDRPRFLLLGRRRRTLDSSCRTGCPPPLSPGSSSRSRHTTSSFRPTAAAFTSWTTSRRSSSLTGRRRHRRSCLRRARRFDWLAAGVRSSPTHCHRPGR